MPYDDDDDQQDPPGREPLDPRIRERLRAAEKIERENAELKAQVEANQNEVLFARAGVPEEAGIFRRGYDGEKTVEAIKAAYEPFAAPPPASDPDLEALRRVGGATVGTGTNVPDAGAKYLSDLAAASNPEEVMKIVESDEGRSLGVWTHRGQL